MIIPSGLFFNILLFILGLVALIKGGDWFVDGSVGVARRFRLPELLIGATVVSIGTTLPEVMVSATSAVGGHGEIAYGNAIGSIICNTALISAIPLAVKPGNIDRKSLKLPVIFFFIAALFYAAISYTSGFFSRISGIAMLMIFAVYMIFTILNMRSSSLSDQPETEEKNEKQNTPAKDIMLMIIGAVLIAIGARLLVDNGIQIASAIGVPESVIALTFVALGTSLPELVTAITALVKGHGLLSLGNVIGANLFNIVLVSGLSVTLSPFKIPQNSQIAGVNTSLIVDIPVMLFVMCLLTLPALIKQKTYRFQGFLLLGIYIAFCIFQFVI